MGVPTSEVVLLTNSDGELLQTVSGACGLPQEWSREISHQVENRLANAGLCVCLIEFGESRALECTEAVWDRALSNPLRHAFEAVRSALRAFRDNKRGDIVVFGVGTRGLAAIGQSFLACLVRSVSLEGAPSGVRAVGLACEEASLRNDGCRSLLRTHFENRESLPNGNWAFLPSVGAMQSTGQPTSAGPAPLVRNTAKGQSAAVVAITGAARGIGRAMAKVFAEGGCNTALFDQDGAALSETSAALRQPGFSICEVVGDAGRREDLELLAKTAVQRWGRIDAWINNAAYCARGRVEEITAEQIERTLDVNLRSAWRSAQLVAQANGTEGGEILNISSTAAFTAGLVYPGRYNAYAPYAASKAGLLALTRTLAREAAPLHLRVNALAPGPVLTELARNIYSEDELHELAGHLPAGRLAMPEEIAAAAKFLLSHEASLITGQVLAVDGGLSLQQA